VLRGLRGAGGVQGPLTAAPPAGPGVPSGPGWVWLQLVISPRPGGSQVPLRRAGYGGGRAQERDEEGSGGQRGSGWLAGWLAGGRLQSNSSLLLLLLPLTGSTART
jgi:hypothetical protein